MPSLPVSSLPMEGMTSRRGRGYRGGKGWLHGDYCTPITALGRLQGSGGPGVGTDAPALGILYGCWCSAPVSLPGSLPRASGPKQRSRFPWPSASCAGSGASAPRHSSRPWCLASASMPGSLPRASASSAVSVPPARVPCSGHGDRHPAYPFRHRCAPAIPFLAGPGVPDRSHSTGRYFSTSHWVTWRL